CDTVLARGGPWRSIAGARAGPPEERERSRARNLDLAERAQVDQPDPIANGSVLLPHPIEPVRAGPASLARQAAAAPRGLAGVVQVRALPARLGAEHGA